MYVYQTPSILELKDASEPEVVAQNVRIRFPGIKRFHNGERNTVTMQTQQN